MPFIELSNGSALSFHAPLISLLSPQAQQSESELILRHSIYGKRGVAVWGNGEE
ncbi:hypothetical protein BVRB_4g081730 [Beta vulgaris subsp. vulgaris]|nr:hypothetical protein BVRB_4g081730 [Beta vulgaris subsp. vulgaris]